MHFKVIKQQPNANMCFVCGKNNHSGLKTKFYELENQQLVGIFKGLDVHQSYPERMHGGIIAALLDETIARAIQIEEPHIWGITIDLIVKYLKPVPLESKLSVVARITLNRSRLFEGEGYLMDENMVILATAQAKYLKQKIENLVSKEQLEKDIWEPLEDEEKVVAIKLPQ
jgi:acyl-coenzyme A thioesterase PaaI-like protein